MKTSKVRGWKAIAARLEIDERTARRWSRRALHRLEVRHDYKGYYIAEDVLAAFMAERDQSVDELVAARQAS